MELRWAHRIGWLRSSWAHGKYQGDAGLGLDQARGAIMPSGGISDPNGQSRESERLPAGLVRRSGPIVKTQTLFVVALSTILLSTATSAMAQRVPVNMQARYVPEDITAIRFSHALTDEIQLSLKFSLWTGKLSELPLDGISITVRSVQVKMTDGKELCSVLFIEADRPSGKDPGYLKVLKETMWMIPKDGSVTDVARGFLADVDKRLEP